MSGRPGGRAWRAVLSALVVVLAMASAGVAQTPGGPPRLSVGGSGEPAAHPIGRKASGEGRSGGTGGWWLGTLGVAAAFVAFAGLSLANRRARAAVAPGSLEVVGRVALGARQSAVLLRAGGRVLIVGVGPQGAPSLLGELPEVKPVPAVVRVASPGREGGAS